MPRQREHATTHTIDGRPIRFTLCGVGDYDFTNPNADEARPLGINWAAYGTVTTEDARHFVRALTEAIEEAERLNAAQ